MLAPSATAAGRACRLVGTPRGALSAPLLATLGFLTLAAGAVAADIDDARELYRTGKYAQAIRAASEAIKAGSWDESWRELVIRAHLTRGEYGEALAALDAAMRQFSTSVRMRLLAVEVYRYNNQPAQAEAALKAIEVLATQSPWRYSDAANRITLGRALVLMGADARQVLELFYDRVKTDQPDYVETYVATGALGLEKSDLGVAAEAFEQAAKRRPDDPDILFGLARAYADSDPEKANASLAAALEANPRHIDSLLFQVDSLIDSESYDEAGKLLDKVVSINAKHPRAWACRAVLAHLDGDEAAFERSRQSALAAWETNPEVDHLIGRKLSQKYRFAEGAQHQRQALGFDDDYVPAKIQLSQDLLRLGEEDEGWRLADEVHEQDGYNVLAYNLVTLEDAISKFRSLEDDDFIVRMDAREAEIYGARVLDLLHRAKLALCAKYEVALDEPVIVEIFPRQSDFAIRTFGMPGGAGYLGVCFGRVITANSPASQGGSPSNWEAVLWHEFCHVVTLSKTRNKMPRWLSEGISVYEERQENAAWGQEMTPRYRQMILEKDLVPIGKLSGAFLQPPTPMHLQFAYYESSLVVEFMVGRVGIAGLRRLLDDLALSIPINAAIERHVGPLDELEAEFAEFARQRARELAPKADWRPLELAPDATLDDVVAWNNEHPNHHAGLVRQAAMLLAAKRTREAVEVLERAVSLYPAETGMGSAPLLLAETYSQLGETDRERAVLESLAARDAEAVSAYARLAELAAADDEWAEVAASARRFLAVNPLVAAGHAFLADAAERTGDLVEAERALLVVLALDPIDPAEVNYRLARLYQRTDDHAQARRHALAALEEAPRYRAAHRLLLEVVRAGPIVAPAANDAPEAAGPAPTGGLFDRIRDGQPPRVRQ